MNQALEQLAETISGRFAGQVTRVESRCGELTFEVAPAGLLTICQALRDEAGRPIRSIVVGVDVSPDGCIVKAGILGNVELDRESIALDWGL